MRVEFDTLDDLISQGSGVLGLSYLDLVDLLHTVDHPLQVNLLNESQSQSVIVVSACPPHAMQVDVEIDTRFPLGQFGWSYIDDEASISDVDSSGDDVGGQQNIGVVVPEPRHNVLLLSDGHLDLLAVLVLLAGDDAHRQGLEVLGLIGCEVRSLHR